MRAREVLRRVHIEDAETLSIPLQSLIRDRRRQRQVLRTKVWWALFVVGALMLYGFCGRMECDDLVASRDLRWVPTPDAEATVADGLVAGEETKH